MRFRRIAMIFAATAVGSCAAPPPARPPIRLIVRQSPAPISASRASDSDDYAVAAARTSASSAAPGAKAIAPSPSSLANAGGPDTPPTTLPAEPTAAPPTSFTPADVPGSQTQPTTAPTDAIATVVSTQPMTPQTQPAPAAIAATTDPPHPPALPESQNDRAPHPALNATQGWGETTWLVIVAMFAAAAVMGPLVRTVAPEEIPPAASHDEPPGASHHHGIDGTLNRPPRREA